MRQPAARSARTLRATPSVLRWGVLLAASLAFIVPLQLIHLPAALLLGAMAAAILFALFEGQLAVPRWPFVLAQGLIGCLVARSIGPAILMTVVRQWPLFLAGCLRGAGHQHIARRGAGARWKVLPGTTAVWGSAPGAATVMVLMSEGFGGDPRLVAFMQFLRVMLVALRGLDRRAAVGRARRRRCHACRGLVSRSCRGAVVGDDARGRGRCHHRRQLQDSRRSLAHSAASPA